MSNVTKYADLTDTVTAWKLYEKLGRPKYLVAPMVDASELAFRQLTRKYGAELCYTPMINAKQYATSKGHRKKHFITCKEDRPLGAQFCSDNPEYLLQAAKLVQDECDFIDLNFGCPQKIARRGHYGAFLLEEWDLIYDLISTVKKNLNIPVTCKIRILPEKEKTMQLVEIIQRAGCSMLTVHGRTKEEMKARIGPVDLRIISEIKQFLKIPVFANGGMETMKDVQHILNITKCDGVMSSEAVLGNPAFFHTHPIPMKQLMNEYLEICKDYPPTLSQRNGHMCKFLYPFMQIHPELRRLPGTPAFRQGDYIEMFAALDKLEQDNPKLAQLVLTRQASWYYRHQRKTSQKENVAVDDQDEQQPERKRQKVKNKTKVDSLIDHLKAERENQRGHCSTARAFADLRSVRLGTHESLDFSSCHW